MYEKLLDSIRAAGRWRSLRELPGTGGKLTTPGGTLLNFSSNDYLDLANDPRLKAAAQEAIAEYGCGATASRLMAGHLPLHASLEASLASLTGHETSLVLPSGFQSNIAVLSGIANQGDHIYSDKLNHASIIDGARLSRSTVRAYKHKDIKDLEKLLAAAHGEGRRIVVSDSLFSMDGDLAPVAELAEVARRYQALLVVDEAHALGVFGQGGGLCRERGVLPDITVGTLSKSFGGGGGFAACSTPLRDVLINCARPFIYSTGLAPGCLGSASAAAAILAAEPGLGEALLARARFFVSQLHAAGLEEVRSESSIIPILLPGNDNVMRAAQRLWDQGLLVTGIRPPTVAPGTERLRLTVTLAHTEDDLARAAGVIAATIRKYGGAD